MAQAHLVFAGKINEFPFGRKKLVVTEIENILVVNVGGEFFAVSNTCPHSGGFLNYGPLQGYIIECPLHFWPYDLRTGKLQELEGITEMDLNTYPVIIKDGEIFIELPL